jgi:hypothetical protein
MHNLRIDKPCPILLMRMEQTGENFSCKSCKKEVVDFRTKSAEEIAAILTPDTCGIFNNSQLSAQQPQFSFFRKGIFAALTVFSFLGFNVNPVSAAPAMSLKHGITQSAGVPDEQDKKPKQKKKRHKKAKDLKIIGCPSF